MLPKWSGIVVTIALALTVAGSSIVAWLRPLPTVRQPFRDDDIIGYYVRDRATNRTVSVRAWYRSTEHLSLDAAWRDGARRSRRWGRDGMIRDRRPCCPRLRREDCSECDLALSPNVPIPYWLQRWSLGRSREEYFHPSRPVVDQ
ncbi:MAG: hypothetical protein KDC38_12595 [Planctomycetes bacterium]|nr:hypothetical protein [Planctomycetota bacterium]